VQDGAVGYQGLQEVYHIGDLVTAELGSLGGTRVAYRVGDVRFDTNRSVSLGGRTRRSLG
jgi:hypothetical protein